MGIMATALHVVVVISLAPGLRKLQHEQARLQQETGAAFQMGMVVVSAPDLWFSHAYRHLTITK